MDRRRRLSTSRGSRRVERGIALVVVLWVVALLAVMSMSYSYSTRIEALTVRNATDSIQTRFLAETGVTHALWVLADADLASQWPADGTPHSISTDDGVIEISIVDESGFININRAAPELLDGILRVVGVDSGQRKTIADAIVDWRDPDSIRSPHGAEDSDYAAAGLSYGAKDAPFDSVEELQLVAGMTAEIFRSLDPYVTVYGGQSGVNTAVAPREILLALPDSEPERVESLLAERGEATQAAMSTMRRASGIYRISARAELHSGAQQTLRAIVLVVPGSEPQFTVLSWKENF